MSNGTGLIRALKRVRSLKEKGDKDMAIMDLLILVEIFNMNETQIMQRDLAVRMEADHDIVEAVLSHSLKKLIEKHKFLSRTPAPENYRHNILSLTPRGKTFIEDLLGDIAWQSVREAQLGR